MANRQPKRARARVPYRALRAALLLLGLAIVASLAVLLAAHRFGSTEAPQESDRTVAETPLNNDDLFRSEGFDFTQTVGGRRVFTIRAEGFRQDREDTIHLRQVELTLYRPNDETYHVVSDEADYHPDTAQAELRGHVQLRSETLELDTRSLSLGQDGQRLTSNGAVVFRYPPALEGRASRLRAELSTDRYVMSGGVHIRSTPAAPMPFKLDCERLNHQRQLGVIRALGDVRLERGADRIAAENLTVHFENDLRDIKTIRARIDVEGEIDVGAPVPPRRLRFRGNTLLTQFDLASGRPRQVELEALDGASARIELDDSGLIQAIDGRYLVAYLAAGDLQLVEGFGDALQLTEQIDASPPVVLRQACARRLEARFTPDGEIAGVRLESDVELMDRGLFLTGGTIANIDWAGGNIDIRGPRVSLFDARGEVAAQQFSYRRDRGIIRAEGEVRTILADQAAGALDGSPLARGQGPIQVESTKAVWTLEPPTFAFRGNVRAWRGDNLVLAEQLRGEQNERSLAASGNVKTVWTPRGEGDGGTVARLGGNANAPIEVTAKQLDYQETSRQLVYRGDVLVTQTNRQMRCRELTVELDDDGGGEARRMVCQDDVELDDPATNRKIEADRAIYTLANDQVEFFGDAVRLRDGDGGEVTSKYVVYDVETGTMRLARAPAETTTPASGGMR